MISTNEKMDVGGSKDYTYPNCQSQKAAWDALKAQNGLSVYTVISGSRMNPLTGVFTKSHWVEAETLPADSGEPW